ncbi:hypothetical protein MHYP_G00061510 [Metynnis hypsauchen]
MKRTVHHQLLTLLCFLAHFVIACFLCPSDEGGRLSQRSHSAASLRRGHRHRAAAEPQSLHQQCRGSRGLKWTLEELKPCGWPCCQCLGVGEDTGRFVLLALAILLYLLGGAGVFFSSRGSTGAAGSGALGSAPAQLQPHLQHQPAGAQQLPQELRGGKGGWHQGGLQQGALGFQRGILLCWNRRVHHRKTESDVHSAEVDDTSRKKQWSEVLNWLLGQLEAPCLCPGQGNRRNVVVPGHQRARRDPSIETDAVNDSEGDGRRMSGEMISMRDFLVANKVNLAIMQKQLSEMANGHHPLHQSASSSCNNGFSGGIGALGIMNNRLAETSGDR